jgi:hypothetical protein
VGYQPGYGKPDIMPPPSTVDFLRYPILPKAWWQQREEPTPMMSFGPLPPDDRPEWLRHDEDVQRWYARNDLDPALIFLRIKVQFICSAVVGVAGGAILWAWLW